MRNKTELVIIKDMEIFSLIILMEICNKIMIINNWDLRVELDLELQNMILKVNIARLAIYFCSRDDGRPTSSANDKCGVANLDELGFYFKADIEYMGLLDRTCINSWPNIINPIWLQINLAVLIHICWVSVDIQFAVKDGILIIIIQMQFYLRS